MTVNAVLNRHTPLDVGHVCCELLPSLWNKTWLTKRFISATIHNEYHHYFTGNFGGYTTIWDRLCATMRPK